MTTTELVRPDDLLTNAARVSFGGGLGAAAFPTPRQIAGPGAPATLQGVYPVADWRMVEIDLRHETADPLILQLQWTPDTTFLTSPPSGFPGVGYFEQFIMGNPLARSGVQRRLVVPARQPFLAVQLLASATPPAAQATINIGVSNLWRPFPWIDPQVTSECLTDQGGALALANAVNVNAGTTTTIEGVPYIGRAHVWMFCTAAGAPGNVVELNFDGSFSFIIDQLVSANNTPAGTDVARDVQIPARRWALQFVNPTGGTVQFYACVMPSWAAP